MNWHAMIQTILLMSAVITFIVSMGLLVDGQKKGAAVSAVICTILAGLTAGVMA